MNAADLDFIARERTEQTPVPYPNAYVTVVPNGKKCPISGLSHGHLYSLLTRGEASKHVRTVRLREPGATRGKLLFHAGDFLAWFDRLAAQQAKARRETM
jgi:hypothetical protein